MKKVMMNLTFNIDCTNITEKFQFSMRIETFQF